MYAIGSVARVRSPQVAGLLNEDGSLACPIQTIRITPEIPLLLEGAWDRLLYVRLMEGKHAQRLAAIPRQDLVVLGGLALPLLIA